MDQTTPAETTYRRVAVIGSGTIATGLAAVASTAAETVVLLARSTESAERAEGAIAKALTRLKTESVAAIEVTIDQDGLAGSGLVVEAVAEDADLKIDLLTRSAGVAPEADLATTTSSLSISGLAAGVGRPGSLVGIHVFNPVTGMDLVELCVPDEVPDEVADRAESWCREVGKTPVRVPDIPGFVVNRLLFPYLFEAVRLMEATGMEPADVDTCMKLGVGHPMGPLALLDLVGLDVAVAIGETLAADSGDPNHLAPSAISDRVARGDLGRKTGRGFFEYGA